jgi:20S proteasome alpha/beta subunit
MTIAAGFRCFDGVVLCTDSEHTAGQTKFYDKKIFELSANNATGYVAGAGDSVYIKLVADEVKSLLKGKDVSLDQITVAAGDTVSDTYQTYFTASRQAADPNTPTMLFLLALYVDGEKRSRIYRITETGGVSEVDSEYSAIGTEAGEAVLREMADLFFREQEVSVFTMRHLAVHMIHRVVRFASYCGGSAQVACIQDGGMTYLDNEPSSTPGEDYISEIMGAFPGILESCVSGDQKLLQIYLERFNDRIREAAAKRKKFLGEHHPTEANGWSW